MKLIRSVLVLSLFPVLFSCSKSASFSASSSTSQTTTVDFYTISDGTTTVTHKATDKNFTEGTGIGGDEYYTGAIYSPGIGNYTDSTDGTDNFSISKGTFIANMDSVVSDFTNFFPIGNYTYSVNATNGVAVNWRYNSKDWSTSNGSNQSGSTFNVSSAKTIILDGSYLERNIAGTFSCNLYDSIGTLKHVTGSFSLTISN